MVQNPEQVGSIQQVVTQVPQVSSRAVPWAVPGCTPGLCRAVPQVSSRAVPLGCASDIVNPLRRLQTLLAYYIPMVVKSISEAEL